MNGLITLKATDRDLCSLCGMISGLLRQNKLEECEMLISNAMGNHPSAPEPHNLYGLILESRGKHCDAMKHFRAAWALDPTYDPARKNLDYFGDFSSHATAKGGYFK